MAESSLSYVRLREDSAGEWRWSAIGGNEQVVAVAGEGYTRREDAKRSARDLFGDDVEIRTEFPSDD